MKKNSLIMLLVLGAMALTGRAAVTAIPDWGVGGAISYSDGSDAAITLTVNLSANDPTMVFGANQISLGNMAFDIDQTIGAGQDNYVLTYDNTSGQIRLEVATGGSGDAWGDVVDADIIPDADGTRDLGSTGTRFAALFVDDLTVTNDINANSANTDRLDYNEQASLTLPLATKGTIYLDSDDNTFKGLVADQGNTEQTFITDLVSGISTATLLSMISNEGAAGTYLAGDGSWEAPASVALKDGNGVEAEGAGDAIADDSYQAFKQITGRNAGETIAQWEMVYLNSTGEWMKADADASQDAGKAWGIAAEAGTSGNPMDVIISGIIRNDTWTWTGSGKDLFVSDVAGALTETAPSTLGDVVKIVARTLSDDEIYIDVTHHFFLSDGN